MNNAITLCDNLVKIYKLSEIEVVALQGLDLAVQPGEVMALLGSSGSGKITLLNVLGGLDRRRRGTVELFGRLLNTMSQEHDRTVHDSPMRCIRCAMGRLSRNN